MRGDLGARVSHRARRGSVHRDCSRLGHGPAVDCQGGMVPWCQTGVILGRRRDVQVGRESRASNHPSAWSAVTNFSQLRQRSMLAASLVISLSRGRKDIRRGCRVHLLPRGGRGTCRAQQREPSQAVGARQPGLGYLNLELQPTVASCWRLNLTLMSSRHCYACVRVWGRVYPWLVGVGFACA